MPGEGGGGGGDTYLIVAACPRLANQRAPFGDFPGGAVVKNPPASAGNTCSIPGLGRSHVPQSN